MDTNDWTFPPITSDMADEYDPSLRGLDRNQMIDALNLADAKQGAHLLLWRDGNSTVGCLLAVPEMSISPTLALDDDTPLAGSWQMDTLLEQTSYLAGITMIVSKAEDDTAKMTQHLPTLGQHYPVAVTRLQQAMWAANLPTTQMMTTSASVDTTAYSTVRVDVWDASSPQVDGSGFYLQGSGDVIAAINNLLQGSTYDNEQVRHALFASHVDDEIKAGHYGDDTEYLADHTDSQKDYLALAQIYDAGQTVLAHARLWQSPDPIDSQAITRDPMASFTEVPQDRKSAVCFYRKNDTASNVFLCCLV